MKKQVKSLIIGLVILAALGGLLYFLVNMPEKEESSSSSSLSSSQSQSQPEKVMLSSFELEDLESIEVKNEEEYTIIRDREAGPNEWVIEELRGLPKYKNNYAFLAMNLADQAADSILAEDVTDMDQYGLKNPVSEVTGVLKDGSRHTLYFGKTAPGGDSVYVTVPNSTTVYLISASSSTRYYQKKIDYISKELYTIRNTEGLPDVSKATLGGTVRNSDTIVIESIESTAENAQAQSMGLSTYQMTAPTKKEANTQVFSDTIQSFFETYVTEVVAYNVEEEDLEQYGLSTPYATAELEFTDVEEEVTVKYSASAPQEDWFYLMKDDIPVVYKATIGTELTETANFWYASTYESLRSRLFLLPYIDDVKTLAVKTPEKSYQFDLLLVEPDTENEKLNISYEGKMLKEEIFKKFYQVVIGSTAEEQSGEELGELGEPLLSYTFVYNDGRQDKMEFYKGPVRMVYVFVNGECEFTTRDAYIDKVYSDVEKVIVNQEIRTDW